VDGFDQEIPVVLIQHLVQVARNYQEGIFSSTYDNVEDITRTPALSIPAFIEKYRAAFEA
jgi:NAD(P)H dehydrogenase (quinone)